MTILREHYDVVIATGLESIHTFDAEAFDKAVLWSKMRYKRKFMDSSVDTLRSMVQRSIKDVPPALSDPILPLTRSSRLSRRRLYASALVDGRAKTQINETKHLNKSENNTQSLNTVVQVDAPARAFEHRVNWPDPPTFLVPREMSVQVHQAASPQSPRGSAESVEPDVSKVPRMKTEGTPETGNNMLEGEGQMMRGKIPREFPLLNEPESESLSNTTAMGLQGGPVLSVRQEPTMDKRTNRKIFDWEISKRL
ncbi:uncharacterized protein [Paramisgurnus dabryanus]|uniref:uncharacterized protein n=1 Tax=Paramisgurnus dabryanus TaxID=90735 RepID=UPI003CCF75C6